MGTRSPSLYERRATTTNGQFDPTRDNGMIAYLETRCKTSRARTGALATLTVVATRASSLTFLCLHAASRADSLALERFPGLVSSCRAAKSLPVEEELIEVGGKGAGVRDSSSTRSTLDNTLETSRTRVHIPRRGNVM